MKNASWITTGLAGAALAVTALTGTAHAVSVPGGNSFVLDFIANGDGSGGQSNFPVAVYWKWDGGTTLGMRIESPAPGFPNYEAYGSWSFNIFNNGDSPGGLNSNGDNSDTITALSIGTLSATSLGAFSDPVDAAEVTWTQPNFDPTQAAIYIQLTVGGDNNPSNTYRMAEYLGQGGTYANSPDIFSTGDFCSTTVGTCAELTFEVNAVPLPAALPLFASGIGGLIGIAGLRRRRRPRAA